MRPTFAILKHNNACGLASRPNIGRGLWKAALLAIRFRHSEVSLLANVEIDADTATEMNELFFEVVIAPSYSAKPWTILKQKKNRVILVQKPCEFPKTQFRSLLNGVWSKIGLEHANATDMNR
jgi:phosphoribosylaminoimidazolecarboxamide formyltransferase/IMP cyclohydrolase